jgi:hypothetical protein
MVGRGPEKNCRSQGFSWTSYISKRREKLLIILGVRDVEAVLGIRIRAVAQNSRTWEVVWERAVMAQVFLNFTISGSSE